jgi:hypothetical protein
LLLLIRYNNRKVYKVLRIDKYMEHYNKKADKKRKKALSERDALAYYKACSSWGFEPEDQELYNEGYGLAEASRKELEDMEKSETFGKYKELVDETKKLGLNPDNVFEHIFEKGGLLKKIQNYYKLKGDSRSIDTLITLKDVKIGKAFKNDYYTAFNALKDLR